MKNKYKDNKIITKLCPHCYFEFKVTNYDGIHCPHCKKGICFEHNCKNEIKSFMSNRCDKHLLKHIDNLKKLTEEWKGYFKGEIKNVPERYDGLLIDTVNRKVDGWTTLTFPRYTKAFQFYDSIEKKRGEML